MRYVNFGNTETIREETLVKLPSSLADARPFAQLYHLADCPASTDPGANEMTVALVSVYVGKCMSYHAIAGTIGDL